MTEPVDVNQRLEIEIGIIQEMFHGERWNAQIMVTHASGLGIVLVGADNVDEVLLALDVFAAEARKDGDPVVIATLSVDTYYLSMSLHQWDGEREPRLRPGELQERFEAGDRDVREAMLCMVVTPTEEAMVYLPYQRIDLDERLDSGIRWQPMIREAVNQGRVLDAMREALR